MIIGIDGRQGSGKTLLMSILGLLFARATGMPLYATYDLKGAKRIENWQELLSLRGSIVLFDEMWKDFDSRKSKENADFRSVWIKSIRHDCNVLFFTVQDLGMIDLRVRQDVDFWVFAIKRFNSQGPVYNYQFALPARGGDFDLGRRLNWPEELVSSFYGVYDTHADFRAL